MSQDIKTKHVTMTIEDMRINDSSQEIVFKRFHELLKERDEAVNSYDAQREMIRELVQVAKCAKDMAHDENWIDQIKALVAKAEKLL